MTSKTFSFNSAKRVNGVGIIALTCPSNFLNYSNILNMVRQLLQYENLKRPNV